MGTSRAEGKRSLKEIEEDEEEEEDDDCTGGLGFEEEEKKKKKGRRGSSAAEAAGASMLPCCQADHCTVDMGDAKRYYKRHKVCEYHAKASFVLVNGVQQRFCQQCSRSENPNSPCFS